jgi:uncharacterized protein YPO0396
MSNQQAELLSSNGRKSLPGFRLQRLEMLNWGTFHEKVAVLTPGARWTLLVGENGSGKSTAVDALRTLIVPPRLLNYNDASGEQKRRDRTRRSYVRGTFGTSSQEDSTSAIPQHLRNPGEYSILLAVFGNEQTGELVTLAEILWELNETIDERYAVARADRNICEDFSNLGQSRELKKTLRQRGFEPFESFTAYAERFRSLLGIPNETALEVFNQAIGVKEVVDINQFIRRHMLEGSDVLDFIHNRLRPHYNELDACWRAIDRAEKQLEALLPIVNCHRRIEEAGARVQELGRLLEITPRYYAHRHLDLRNREAEALANRMNELNRQKTDLEEARRRDETERDAKLQEIAADQTQQSIQRIESQMEAAGERFKNRQQKWSEFTGNLRTLNRAQPVESDEKFVRIRAEVEQQKGLLEGNRTAADDKRVKLLVEQQDALKQRGEIAAQLETLRKHRVLIPTEFVAIREAVSAATRIPVSDLPFAGELLEVKGDFREWTGAIERLLHQFGVSLLVPEQHYLPVAKFINERHLSIDGRGIRFTFHRVPARSTGAFRADILADGTRVPGRLNFREDHALVSWVKAEVTRRFNHICCADVQRLREVDYGLTREGLIRDGPTRHTKDDRRAVNDATNYVLGWSLEEKLRAFAAAFKLAEKKAAIAGEKAEEARKQVVQLDAQLTATSGVLAIGTFTEIDFRSVQIELARLKREKEDLEGSAEKLKVLKGQLQTVLDRLNKNQNETNELLKSIGSVERDQETNENARNDLAIKTKTNQGFDPGPFSESFKELQEAATLTLANIREAEDQVAERLRRQIAHQEGVGNKARNEMLPKMQDFLRDYPEHTANLKADASFAADFAAVRERIEREELPQHRQRFEEFLGTNLVGDTAMFHSNLLEHEKSIRARVDSVNAALRTIRFSDTTHVQIVAQPTHADDIGKFRAELKECLAGGLNPSADDRPRIFMRIRELMTKFEKDDVWTRRVTDARNWLEFNLREIADADGREVQFYSASSGKSGGQKAKLAFTILASAITAQYGLIGVDGDTDTFRLVVIDEAFARTDETNSQRALDLFRALGLQLVVVNPFDAKGRIVEDYVDSFHIAVNPDGNNSKLRCFSRAEYDSARSDLERNGELPVADRTTPTSIHAQSR